jgi:hypothetical protein
MIGDYFAKDNSFKFYSCSLSARSPLQRSAPFRCSIEKPIAIVMMLQEMISPRAGLIGGSGEPRAREMQSKCTAATAIRMMKSRF